jgi:N-acetylneuraminic acid mutarotase
MSVAPPVRGRLPMVALAAALCALAPALPTTAQNPASGWGELAPMPIPRSETAVAELDGKVYVLGGYPAGRIPSDVVQVYDVRTDTWGTTTPLPMPMHHTVAVSVDGTLYAIGGEFGGAGDGNPPVFLDTVFAYEPAKATWEPRAPMPRGASAGGAGVIDGKIYVAGGRPPAGHDFAVYDPRADTWTVLPELPTQRNHIAAGAIDGKMYVAGGRFGPGFNSELTDILEIYDPATNAWTTGPPMPSGVRSGMASIVVNNCLYAIGGEWDRAVPSGVFPQNEAYDAARGSWRVLEPMVTPVHGLTGAALANGRILIPGGSLTNGVSEVSTKLQTFRADLDCR